MWGLPALTSVSLSRQALHCLFHTCTVITDDSAEWVMLTDYSRGGWRYVTGDVSGPDQMFGELLTLGRWWHYDRLLTVAWCSEREPFSPCCPQPHAQRIVNNTTSVFFCWSWVISSFRIFEVWAVSGGKMIQCLQSSFCSCVKFCFSVSLLSYSCLLRQASIKHINIAIC